MKLYLIFLHLPQLMKYPDDRSINSNTPLHSVDNVRLHMHAQNCFCCCCCCCCCVVAGELAVWFQSININNTMFSSYCFGAIRENKRPRVSCQPLYLVISGEIQGLSVRSQCLASALCCRTFPLVSPTTFPAGLVIMLFTMAHFRTSRFL